MSSLNSLAMAHRFIREHVSPGDICIDATAGRGRDTELLCGLVGEKGRVIAFDIQQQAVESTLSLLKEKNLEDRAQVICESHENMDRYAEPESIACIVFNFGWLPGGDHNTFTRAQSSIAAIKKGLELLRHGGVMSLCIYYGKENGFEERDALLEYLETVDNSRYTVIVSRFVNRTGCPAIPAFIIKD